MSICLKCDWDEYWGSEQVPYPGDEYMSKHGWLKGDKYKHLVYNIGMKAFSEDGKNWFPVPEPIVEVVPEPEPVVEPKPWELHPELYTTVNTPMGPHHVLKDDTEDTGFILMAIRDMIDKLLVRVVR